MEWRALARVPTQTDAYLRQVVKEQRGPYRDQGMRGREGRLTEKDLGTRAEPAKPCPTDPAC